MPWQRLFNFQAGTKINSGQVNAELNQLINASNGNEQNFIDHAAENSRKHIKESGSNANGRYIKFDDGTLICWGNASLTFGTTNRLKYVWTFPATFINTEELAVNGNITNAGVLSVSGKPPQDFGILSADAPTTTSCVIQLWVTGCLAGDTATAKPIAIGRWK